MAPSTPADCKALLAQYRQPDLVSSVRQLITSVVPFVALWVIMWLSLRFSYLLTLVLAVPASRPPRSDRACARLSALLDDPGYQLR